MKDILEFAAREERPGESPPVLDLPFVKPAFALFSLLDSSYIK
jgi:hypothetical protein